MLVRRPGETRRNFLGQSRFPLLVSALVPKNRSSLCQSDVALSLAAAFITSLAIFMLRAFKTDLCVFIAFQAATTSKPGRAWVDKFQIHLLHVRIGLWRFSAGTLLRRDAIDAGTWRARGPSTIKRPVTVAVSFFADVRLARSGRSSCARDAVEIASHIATVTKSVRVVQS